MRLLKPTWWPTSVDRPVDTQRPASRSVASAEPNAPPTGPAARVELSAEALRVLAEEAAREEELLDLQRRLPTVQREAHEEQRASREQEALRSGRALSEEDQRALDTLKRWDREIRTHEAAHVGAAGGLAGTPTYDLVTGPDGRRYAVGGSVKVRLSDAGSPEGNAARLRRVKAAATAVADPSAADLRVAGKAERKLQEALRSRAVVRYEAQGEPA